MARANPSDHRKPSTRPRRLQLERLESRQLLAGDTLRPFTGDFDGDGVDSPALYDTSSHRFFLRNANTPGFPQAVFSHGGLVSGTPVTGDWNNDGVDTIGLFQANTKTFRLAAANRSGAAITLVTITNAPTGGVGLVGDWNGDGRDTVAIYHPASYRFFIKNSLASGPADRVFSFWPAITNANRPYGYANPASWSPVAGDFVGDGVDTVGLLQRGRRELYTQKSVGVHLYRRFQLSTMPASNAVVFTGDWDHSGDDSIGYWDRGSVIFRERNWLTSTGFDGELYVPPSTTVVPLGATDPRTVGDVRRNPRIAAVHLGSTTVATRNAPAPFISAGSDFADSAAAIIAQLNDAQQNFITKGEVQKLLDRASCATSSNDAIIAIVDRGGRILGVRVEQGVLDMYAGNVNKLVFAIDGAVSKARTAAFFGSGDDSGSGIAPLTSRTVRFISQSTVTEREVNSNPNFRDPVNFPDPYDSPFLGPGFVAPIGIGGHFPPDIAFTPPVDLFHIEHQSRDGSVHPGLDGLRGTADDIPLPGRFNVHPAFGPLSEYEPPDSYGVVTNRLPIGQNRGIGTLPGGIGLFKDLQGGDGVGDTLVGGIGVFFPGPSGFASFEQNFIPESMRPPGQPQPTIDRLNAPKVLEAEFIAYATAGGSKTAAQMLGIPAAKVGTLGACPPVAGYDLPFGRIDLVGITLEVYGPHPTQHNPRPGIATLLARGQQLGVGASSGADQQVTPNPAVTALNGKPIPAGWLVLPQASGSLSVADVERIVTQGILQALDTRAAIRLPLGSRTRMVLSVADKDGKVLGVFRMSDATVFSIDVSVAKARNTAYYADPTALQPEDFVDDDLLRPDLLAAVAGELNPNGLGNPDIYADINSTVPFNDSRGLAFTNRTFRFLAEPRYPAGQDGTVPPVFSILTDPGINIVTAETLRPNGVNPVAIPASAFTSVAGFDAFHAGRNFHDPDNIANQNGIVFFPGSTPLYEGGVLVGGFGVSGDGVDQDDVVTAAGQVGYAPPSAIRADRVFYRGVRLPFQKFNRNPGG